MRIFQESRTAIFCLSTKCRPTIDQVSTNYWPIHRSSIDQLSAKCRRSVGEVSAKCRRSVGERKAISAETHLERLSTMSRPSVDRLSTDYWPLSRPSIDRVSTEYRPSVDRVSTECRPSIDRVSTECRPLYRPLYRPISRSTLPIVNKIQFSLVSLNLNFFFAHSVLPQIALLAVGSVISSAY